LANCYNSLGNIVAGLGKREQAESAYHAALAIQKKLAADFPTVPEYAVALGGTYCNLGSLITASRRVQDALQPYRKAIQLLREVLAKDNRLVMARQFLRNSHWGRALALKKLKRHAEAVRDWDRAIELDEGPNRRPFRISRAVSLARAGDHVKAVADANALLQGYDVNGAELYNLACVCALALEAVEAAASKGKAESEKLKEQYAERALELLRQASAKGYKEIAHMKKDKDLDPLRQRQDFKKLIAELESRTKSSGVRSQESENKSPRD
jgi:tetratricopeptide (TPR) repeat protein